MENSLSLHIKNYVNQQLNNDKNDEVVAEEEPLEAGNTSGNDEEMATSKGKKEKPGKELDLLEPLGQMQSQLSVKILKKQCTKKLKARAMREWQRDSIRAADADQMEFITHALSKMRQEDKVGLRKTNRSNNGGNHYPYPQAPSQSAFRPPSSSYTSSSTMPVQIRTRFQKKQPSTVVRHSHSNKSKYVK